MKLNLQPSVLSFSATENNEEVCISPLFVGKFNIEIPSPPSFCTLSQVQVLKHSLEVAVYYNPSTLNLPRRAGEGLPASLHFRGHNLPA